MITIKNTQDILGGRDISTKEDLIDAMYRMIDQKTGKPLVKIISEDPDLKTLVRKKEYFYQGFNYFIQCFC